MGLQTVGHDSHSVYIKNSYNAIKKINWLKTRERIWVEISSKKIEKWSIKHIKKFNLFSSVCVLPHVEISPFYKDSIIGLGFTTPNDLIFTRHLQRSKFQIKALFIGTGIRLSTSFQFSSVAQSCPTLRPHESQHARLPCPSSTPGVYSDSCPSSWWCHPAISLSVIPFSSCPNPSQHHGLFQWVSLFHEVAKVVEFQL